MNLVQIKIPERNYFYTSKPTEQKLSKKFQYNHWKFHHAKARSERNSKQGTSALFSTKRFKISWYIKNWDFVARQIYTCKERSRFAGPALLYVLTAGQTVFAGGGLGLAKLIVLPGERRSIGWDVRRKEMWGRRWLFLTTPWDISPGKYKLRETI